MKNPKHKDIIKDYSRVKSKHLDKLANRILKDDEKKENLKKYKLSKKFLDIFK